MNGVQALHCAWFPHIRGYNLSPGHPFLTPLQNIAVFADYLIININDKLSSTFIFSETMAT